MLEKESLDGVPGPVVHCPGQHLHGEVVATEVVANEDDTFDVLDEGGELGNKVEKCQ